MGFIQNQGFHAYPPPIVILSFKQFKNIIWNSQQIKYSYPN